MDRASMLAYWLIPAPAAHDFFASQIAEFAQRFNAPRFEPHLTLYVNEEADDDAMRTIAQVSTEFGPIRLSIEAIRFSENFTKTLFVQFRRSNALTLLSAAIQGGSIRASDYPLDPHLSLIYKMMSSEQKAEAASAIQLSFEEVIFDTIAAVKIPREVRTPEDVAKWETVARHLLNPSVP